MRASWITHYRRHFMIRLSIALTVLLLIIGGAHADAETHEDWLHETILTFHSKTYDRSYITEFIHDHFTDITSSQHTAIEAIIVSREYEDYDLALHIANEALRKGLHSPRLYYEIGLIFLLTQECHEARLIFRYILTDLNLQNTVPDVEWIREESRQALKLCKDPYLWIYDYEFSISYDNNLGNHAPARLIKPEADSVLGKYFETLRLILPNAPQDIVLGVKQKEGVIASIYQYLDQYHFVDGAQYGIHLNSKIGLTSPPGYEDIEAGISLSRTVTSGRLGFTNTLSFKNRHHEQGEGSKRFTQQQLKLANSISLLGQFRPTFGINVSKHRSKITERRDSQHIDLYAQLKHVPLKDRLPWFIEAGYKQNDYKNMLYGSKSNYYGFGLDKLRIGQNHHVGFRAIRETTRPNIPRPWLINRHKTIRDQLSIIYSGLFSGRPFDVTASWNISSSRNQIEDFEHFTLSLRIK